MIMVVLGLSSCFKEDEPIPPHPKGELKVEVIPLTQYYVNQVYFNLSSGEQVSMNQKNEFDLSFSCADTSYIIRLNTSTFMKAAQTEYSNMEQVTDTVGLKWFFDKSDGNPDSTALRNWIDIEDSDTSYLNKVWVINRGIDTASVGNAFLRPKLTELLRPELMPGVVPAVARIKQAIEKKEKITLYGDYDVDGITGVSILLSLLTQLQARVDYYIPHRIDEGYGLNDEAIRSLAETGVDLVITTDVGPRIIRYGFIGQGNEFSERDATLGLTGGEVWKIYGGHRLWHSPEDKLRTYEPDNFPVKWEQQTNGVKTIQDIEPNTGIKKEMEITLSPEKSEVNILHRLTNTWQLPVELSVWSISAMATGGKAVIPQTREDTGLLPNRIIALWPYTKLNDPRLYLGERFIIIQQDPDMEQPLKIGVSNDRGWAAYFNNNHLFVKHYTHVKNAQYPDFGVSYETYTNDYMLELETLSPFTLMEKDMFVEHSEKWELFESIPVPENDEAEIEAVLREDVSPY